jgi:hypothetical protein
MGQGANTLTKRFAHQIWCSSTDATDLPAIAFIRGGSDVSSYTAGPWFNGANFARTANAVVVRVNRRLALFGWLNLAQLKTAMARSKTRAISAPWITSRRWEALVLENADARQRPLHDGAEGNFRAAEFRRLRHVCDCLARRQHVSGIARDKRSKAIHQGKQLPLGVVSVLSTEACAWRRKRRCLPAHPRPSCCRPWFRSPGRRRVPAPSPVGGRTPACPA